MLTRTEPAAADDLDALMRSLPHGGPAFAALPEGRPVADAMCEMILDLHFAGLPTTMADLERRFTTAEIDRHKDRATDMAKTAVAMIAGRGQLAEVIAKRRVRVPAGWQPFALSAFQNTEGADHGRP